jgi:hypothetical protein
LSILLPPDVDFKDIAVSLDNVSEDTLSETYAVNPNIAPSPQYITRRGLILVDGKDMKIYGKNEFYPEDYKGKVFFGGKGQYGIVDVVIYPFLYNRLESYRAQHVVSAGVFKQSLAFSGVACYRGFFI